jgi:two-component system, LytTR family, response regulator
MAHGEGGRRVTLRVLIADDEAPARRVVRSFLAARQSVEIVGEAENGLEVVDAVRSLDPQIVVLDIQMPGMTGFEAIEAIGVEAMPVVIFATAYDEFALAAFDVNAVDYLLKPISRERFDRAFDRAVERVEKERPAEDGGDAERIARLLASLPHAARHLERIVVRRGDRLFFVATRDILHLSAEGNYVRVHTAEGSHLVRDTLARLESRLDPARFTRIHRSGLVNLDAIREIRPHFHGDYLVTLQNDETVRLSRRYRENLLSGHE